MTIRTQVALACLLLATGTALAAPLEKVRLQLKWFSSFQFAGYYMALEKGYYREAGLDVEILERDPARNNILQVAAGEAEYGVADSAVLLYRSQGQPLKILASIFQHSPLVFIARKDSGIYSPYEMKGKTLSFQRGLDDAPLLAVLREANLTEADYRFVPLDFTNMAFVRGEVDVMSAYLSDQPFFMQARGVEFNIINPLSYGIDFYGDNLIASEAELDRHPDRAQAFLRASLAGWKYALANKAETIAALRSKYGAQRSEQQLAHEAKVIEDMMVPDMVAIGYTNIERFQRIADIYVRIGKASRAQVNRALPGLIHDPGGNKGELTGYVYPLLGLVLLLVLATAALLVTRHRLRLMVAHRTEDLRQKMQLLDVILNNSSVGISLVIDRRQAWSNARMTEMFGYSHAEMENQPARLLFPSQEAHDRLVAEALPALARGDRHASELQVRHRDGSLFWARLYIQAVDVDDPAAGSIWVLEDVSDYKRMERMKDEFVSTVSHELRTPLTSIGGALGLINSGSLGELPEPARPMVEVAIRNSERLTRLINDLLDMEKIAAGRMEFNLVRQPLMPLVEQAIESSLAYGQRLGVGIELKKRLDGCEAEVDPHRFLQVLSNLLSNAMKYSQAGDVVEVGVEAQAPGVRISVRDHGPGIPEDFRDRVFEKFAQADASDARAKGGTGLGLAITRGLVERMGGAVGFTPAEGGGTTFFVDLPVAR